MHPGRSLTPAAEFRAPGPIIWLCDNPDVSEIPSVPSARQAGKATRLRRIFGDDGRCVVLPLDHGTILGRVPGLEDPMAVLERLLRTPCDGFLLGPGVLRRSAELFGLRSAPARIMTIDTYWRDENGSGHRLAASIETAAALGVDGVKMLMPWDVSSADRSSTAALVARVVEEADQFGLPVMVEPVAPPSHGRDGGGCSGARLQGCRGAGRGHLEDRPSR